MHRAPEMTDLRLDVADLLHRPAARRTVHLEAVVDGLAGGAARVEAPLVVDATLEPVPGGIVVRGAVRCRWQGLCSRCLAPLDEELVVGFGEMFEHHPVEGETYPIEGDELDLELVVRDAVLLELPGAPLCEPGCRGLCPVCGVNRNQGDCTCDTRPTDPRWAALRELQL